MQRILLVIILLLIGNSGYGNHTIAQSTTPYIIPDSEFSFVSSITQTDFQKLLVSHTPNISPYHQDIYEVAAIYMINPKVLASVMEVLRQNSLGMNYTESQYINKLAVYVDCHESHEHDADELVNHEQDCSVNIDSRTPFVQVDLVAKALGTEYQNQYMNESIQKPDVFVSRYSNRASIVVEKVLSKIIDNEQFVDVVGNEIHQKFTQLMYTNQLTTRKQQASAIQVSRAALSTADQIQLLNSQNLQLPWELGKSLCTTGAVHGFYDGGVTGFFPFGESLDYGVCGNWSWSDPNDKFYVHTMLDGVVTFNPKGLCRLDITKTVPFKGIDRRITIVYMHLDLPSNFSKTSFGRNEYIAPIAMTQYKATCENATGSNGKPLYFSDSPHLHITVLIDGVKVFFSKDQSTYPVKGWNVGGWTNVITQKITFDYDKNKNPISYQKKFCYLPVNSTSKDCNAADAVGKNQWQPIKNNSSNVNPPTWTPTHTPTTVSVVPQLQSPANGHTTTDGLWPTLSWNSTSTGPFEIRVSKNPNFSDCVVCENVSGKSYRPSGSGADAWMRARTGTFYWRVRVAGGTWSSGRLFKNTSLPTLTPTRTPTPVSVVPSLQSPANGHTTTDGLWPTLSWNSTSTGPFEIRVSKNPNFSDCVVCENVSGKSYRPSGSGADGWMRSHIGTLYWRVRVVGGTWSSGRSFQNTIDITRTPSPTRSRTPAPHTPTWTPTRPPPTWTSSPTASPRPTDAELTMPVLSSPADGATDVSTKVELDWQDVTRGNVNRYEVEVCIETSRGSNNWNCDKYDTNGAESRWKVWDRTGKIFPQRKIRWRVNANDGTKDGPVSEWRYFQPRYTYPTGYTVSGDTLKLSISRESNDVTYQCKYNFGGFSGSSWSSVDKTSFSGNSCSFSISSMRSKGANRGRTVYWIITSDSKKTLGDFDGRENTDSRQWSFSMP